MTELPFVSVIIPAYNEERYIGGCLRSLLRGAYPADRWEIIIADGMSTDRTREEIDKVAAESAVPITVIDNPRRVTPVALNLAIGATRGEVIIRVDAHTEYGDDYVARCVQVLRDSGAANVGGPMDTRPGADTPMARAIALAMAHPFGVGNSAFRTQSEAREVDTVPFGCFRREVFQEIGLFDERLWRNQDFELNQRIRQAGGRLWLDPRLHSAYYSRATLPALVRHAWINGFWNALSHALHPYSFCLRHALPVGFVLGLVAVVALTVPALVTGAIVWRVLAVLCWLPYALYLALDLAVALRQGKSWRERAALLVVFPAFHAWYGAGLAWGWINVALRRFPWGPEDGIPSWDERRVGDCPLPTKASDGDVDEQAVGEK
ncbi:MAG: glycosyltransferase family 2 protein [Armatimonadota bacterium]